MFKGTLFNKIGVHSAKSSNFKRGSTFNFVPDRMTKIIERRDILEDFQDSINELLSEFYDLEDKLTPCMDDEELIESIQNGSYYQQ